MARRGPTAEEARRLLVDAAQAFVRARRRAAVVIVTGEVEVIRPAPGGRTAEPEAGELRGYEIAILRALTDAPVSSQRLARLAGHRHNSYLRGQLALLVEAGLVRRSRRGYSRS